MNKLPYSLIILIILISGHLYGQAGLYDLHTVQKIEIFFQASNWDYQLDTSKLGSDGYVMADSVRVNGTSFPMVGVKYKGNSSYDSSYTKNPLHISLNEMMNQSYQGYTDIKLSNGYGDPSQIREVLSYEILSSYMHCPKSNFAAVYINGNYQGLYSNTENVNKEFCSDHFYSSSNTFIKCNPIVIPGPTTKSNLKYINADTASYYNYYEIKSDVGWMDLRDLCDSVTNHGTSIENIMDVDRWIWMLAFDNMLVNLDSYMGAFCQNYYLYQDNNGRYNPIVWDLNMSLGGFPYVGSGASSLGSLTITDMKQLTPTIHATDVNWPMIKNIQGNVMYKRMYFAHARTIIDEYFSNGNYLQLADTLQAIIDTCVQNDANNFFSYSQFQNGMTTDNAIGSYNVPGISNLMSARTTYLQGLSDFTSAQPTIGSISTTLAPPVGSTVNITASINNANYVYLGYRFSGSENFVHAIMYDDGAHNDGAAGDMVYGTSITMNMSNCQYYIYAENSAAGVFSPQRAEYEFYSLQSDIQSPQVGQIFLNEFLASNQSDETDETGQHEDWIEIYNVTDQTLDLTGLFLSDDFSNPHKYTFPNGTILQPTGFLIIWADEDSSISDLHCNFKLSAAGEQLILSNLEGEIYDSLTFGAQSADISYGRCSDGYGPWQFFNVTSLGDYNCPVGIDESEVFSILIYPNPASESIYIQTNSMKTLRVNVYNLLGSEVCSINYTTGSKIDTSAWENGIYMISVSEKVYKIIVSH